VNRLSEDSLQEKSPATLCLKCHADPIGVLPVGSYPNLKAHENDLPITEA
jgi:hypothetical protein